MTGAGVGWARSSGHTTIARLRLEELGQDFAVLVREFARCARTAT